MRGIRMTIINMTQIVMIMIIAMLVGSMPQRRGQAA